MLIDVKHVLIITSHPHNPLLTDQSLVENQSYAFEFSIADSINSALSHLNQENVDVILLDLALPEHLEIENFRQICTAAPKIPVIVIAGEKDEDAIIQAVQAGAHGYLIKENLTADLTALSIRCAIERSLINAKLKEFESLFRIMMDSGPDAIFIQINGRFVYANPNAIRLFGAESSDELLGAPVINRFDQKPHSEAQARIQLLNEGKQSAPFLEEVFLKMDGTPFFAEVGAVAIHWEGQVGGLVFFRDITRRVQVDQHLRLLSTALEAAANAIVITDHQGIISWVNPAFTTLSGYTAQEVIGQNLRLLKSGIQDEEYYAGLWDTIRSGKVWQNEIINRRKDGSLYTEDMTVTPVQGEGGQITHFIAIKQDITVRKHVQAQLNDQVQELQRWFNITQGRESRILALKNEVNELLKKSGKPPRYPSAITDR